MKTLNEKTIVNIQIWHHDGKLLTQEVIEFVASLLGRSREDIEGIIIKRIDVDLWEQKKGILNEMRIVYKKLSLREVLKRHIDLTQKEHVDSAIQKMHAEKFFPSFIKYGNILGKEYPN